MPELQIADRPVGEGHPTYFIADIAANHDGVLERALDLISLAREAGADAAKFQHFRAPKIVSKAGFEALGTGLSHQASWKKSVYEVFADASVPWEWTERLVEHCNQVGIHFFSAPYDFEAVDMLEPFVPAYKIGSGDITWPEMLQHIASKQKPVILSTGAADIDEVQRAVSAVRDLNPQIALLQCNTNYTGDPENFKYTQLRVLQTYQAMYPDLVVGLSDHTPGHATVLGAIALGARIVEKHLTDDTTRDGPDHRFSMTPATWREMVERARELEQALGHGDKRVEENEMDTVVAQRRCLRAAGALAAGTVLTRERIDVLRPAPRHAIMPHEIEGVVGRRTRVALDEGEELTWDKLE